MSIFSKFVLPFASLALLTSVNVQGSQKIELSHASRLNVLKDQGFQPKVIYDIGAHRGSWSCEVEQVFKEARFYLFEANESQKPYLAKLSHPFYIAVLGDRNDVVTFFCNNSTGDSLLKEKTRYYDEGRCVEKKVTMTTLKDIISKNELPLPNLIKMDVQGAEKMIIQGSPEVVKHADVVILETKILEYNENAPLMLEIVTMMHQLGFRAIDILEMHYLPTRELNEIDLLFVKEDSPLIKRGKLI